MKFTILDVDGKEESHEITITAGDRVVLHLKERVTEQERSNLVKTMRQAMQPEAQGFILPHYVEFKVLRVSE